MNSDLSKGQLVKWNDDRGFGFIKPSEGKGEGNISVSSGSKLYHVAGMEDYEGTKIDPSKGEKWF